MAGLKYGDFSHLDMIQLNANEVGVIINIEGDTAEVIDVNNLVKTRKLQGILLIFVVMMTNSFRCNEKER